jgi:hypothetical protein
MKAYLKIVAAAAWLGLSAWAAADGQTNRIEFRGCRVGDTVSFQAARPMVLAARATVLAITTNHVTVACGRDRFVVAYDDVVLMEKHNPSGDTVAMRAPATPGGPAALSADRPRAAGSKSLTSPPGVEALLDMVQAQVLGGFSGDENYAKATNYFLTTMRDYCSGKTTEADLRAKAAEVLAQVDRYPAERQKDPQYEPFIATLRNFVENRKSPVP